MTDTEQGSKSALPKLALLAAVAVLVVGLIVYFDVDELLKGAMDYIAELGPVGAAVFVAVYIVACVLMVPGSVLTLGAGAIWGVGWGTAIVSISSTLGATAAFVVGRYLARNWVAKKVAGNEKFESIDSAVGREGWKIVGLTRLSPVFPFNLLNYAFGLTKVGLRDYFFASWAGMLPGTVMYVYLGSVAGSLATAGASDSGGADMGQWALRIIGLLATVGVTLYITKIAKAALAKKV